VDNLLDKTFIKFYLFFNKCFFDIKFIFMVMTTQTAQRNRSRVQSNSSFLKFFVSIITLFSIVLGVFGLVSTKNVEAATALSEKSPNYFYDRESAFIIQYGLDSVNKGMYLAVDKDGGLLDDPINMEVWGYGAEKVRGTDKTQVGQATCMRYFMNEYLRARSNGVAGINEILPAGKKLTNATDLLLKAASCADFAMEKMEIPANKQNQTRIINGLYYWGLVNKDGSTTLDDTNEENTFETYRKESSLPWTLAELALMMKKYGVAGEQKYVDGALRWWNWKKDRASSLNEVAGSIESGAGRDMYYPALGWTLTQLTGNNEYRDGTGEINNDGTPYGAIPFMNDSTGNGTTPNIPFGEPEKALQEKSYAATWGRGFMFAKHQNEFDSEVEDRDQWQDFGWNPLIGGSYPDYYVTAPANISDSQMTTPFKHYNGRELTSGLIKSAWWFGSYGTNPDMFYIADNEDAGSLSQGDFLNATKSFWDYNNEKLWDDTAGQQAWLEAVGQPFKPCFSGDNDIPFVDWKAPVIGEKVHSVNSDRSATVTVSDVEDEDVPFMSVALLGSGVKSVEVVYTTNNGSSWSTIPASFNGTNYTATIPAVNAGTRVYYYAKAKDLFNNQSVFPAGSEVFNSSNETQSRDVTKAQTYIIPGANPVDPSDNPGGGNGGGTTDPGNGTNNGGTTNPGSGTVKPVETNLGGGAGGTGNIGQPARTQNTTTGSGAGGTGSLIRTGGAGTEPK
jgi:hypothetical protein